MIYATQMFIRKVYKAKRREKIEGRQTEEVNG